MQDLRARHLAAQLRLVANRAPYLNKQGARLPMEPELQFQRLADCGIGFVSHGLQQC